MARVTVTSFKLAKTCLAEFKLTLLLIMIFTILWKFEFLNKIGHDWQQFSFEQPPDKREESVWWHKSPLWVEDQKPHVNPHKYRCVLLSSTYITCLCTHFITIHVH